MREGLRAMLAREAWPALHGDVALAALGWGTQILPATSSTRILNPVS